jgi:uncharacterized protein YecT (DUF1311 family)
MNRLSVILLSFVFAASVSAGADKELIRLEAALDAARSQTDMNLQSGDIAQYLDRKVTELENRIKKDLDSDALALFTAASDEWRKYRIAETRFEGDTYRGGSIQPLIHNQVFSRITQERLEALRNLNPEGRYKQE